MDDKNELLKEAADALDRAHKHDEAIKIAFNMVERGKVPPFESYDAFASKVAELEEKNLAVVREALDLDGTLADFGKVASTGGTATDPHEAFLHALTDD